MDLAPHSSRVHGIHICQLTQRTFCSHGTIRYRGEQEAADRRKRGSISLVAGKSGYYYHRNRPDNDADFVTNNEGDALIKNNVHMLEVSRNPNSGLNDVFFVCPPGQSNKVHFTHFRTGALASGVADMLISLWSIRSVATEAVLSTLNLQPRQR